MQNTNKKLFEETPIPQAVRTMMIPTIIGALVMVLYSLADTLFVGMMNDKIQNAAVALAAPALLAFNAVIKLFCMLLLFYPSYCKKKENKHKSESKVSVIDKRDCFWCNGSWNTGSDSKSFKCNRNDHFKQLCCWIWIFCSSSSRHCTKSVYGSYPGCTWRNTGSNAISLILLCKQK